jgi:elongation factor P--beta-lysine ligase
MIVSKVQKQPKLNKVVVVAPQAFAAMTGALAQVSASQDRIRERAFEIYEKRGSNSGNDMQDWLRAERQILTH